MILYRARSIGSRPSRTPQFEGNEPQVRIRGRWFTSVQAEAIAFGTATFRAGHWELISIEIADDIVDSLRVATTPNTVDGLSPIDFADKPSTEYVVQAFRVMDAVPVAMSAEAVGFRVRDYIHVNAPRSEAMSAVAEAFGLPITDLPLAA